MIDIRQTQEYGKYLSKIGWTTIRKNETNYFIKKIPILGSVLKIQRPEHVDIKFINQLALKYGVFRKIIEPKTKLDAIYLTKTGYRLSKSPYLPTKTIHIDLTDSKKSILKKLNKKTRYSIKRGGVLTLKEYSTPKEIETFRKAWKNSVNLSRYVPATSQLLALKSSFSKFTPLFLTSHNVNAEIIGGSIFTRSGRHISYYWQSFASKEGRTSLSSYSLLWNGLLWAKSKGCKIMDLEGIYDERFPNKKWLGFTHFKKSFGGNKKEYPGAYIKTRFPFKWNK